ncbi:nucleoid-associated protein [Elizabethkingia sp. JS20170427COW]|uniref:nucleoid-associated protein n=1 Tax=Elizabethkingia sp. JS20170427COW TaxID=2583851 RepID=UPI0011104626|nr:nucleoid-associated protein [Elizabethkingia sp. JS20170427COW]QCX53659.1 nucleoid-associated protein [Elizabethkingia sp. JS20170427COW]
MSEDNIRRLEHVSVHYIRNKASGEGFITSENPLELTPETTLLLKNFFLTPFKTNIYFQFYNEEVIENNTVFSLATKIFEQPEFIHEESKNLAQFLHNQTLHSNIKDGEFFVTYFKDYIVEGQIVDAIGLFKTENKETFLNIHPNEEQFSLDTQQGISLKKLDRGCLIFNTEKEKGYMIQIIDTTKGSGPEAQYWVDDFLQVQQRKDEYFETEYTLSMYKDYITEQLPQEYEVSKVDQADLLNKSINFFKEKENFEIDEFKKQVLVDPEVIESFDEYKKQYEEDRDINLSESFAINTGAVKKQQRYFKSVIKLDKNFHIYVHGDRKMLEQGEDEKGKYYRLYFEEEL